MPETNTCAHSYGKTLWPTQAPHRASGAGGSVPTNLNQTTSVPRKNSGGNMGEGEFNVKVTQSVKGAHLKHKV